LDNVLKMTDARRCQWFAIYVSWQKRARKPASPYLPCRSSGSTDDSKATQHCCSSLVDMMSDFVSTVRFTRYLNQKYKPQNL